MANKKYLYVMQSGKYIKIGISSNPEYRIKQLQTGNPERIILLCKAHYDNVEEAERYFHKKLSDHNSVGEWFLITDSIKQCVKDIKIREYKQSGGIN